MKNIKFGVFFLGLAIATSGVVSLAAQDRSERRRPNVMVLDGRGAQLGVMVSDVEAKEPQGVRIDDVNPDSPAEKAGLREGDVVVEYDGERVRSARQFTRLVQETPDGRTVKIAVLRNGQKQTFDATPENRAAMNFDFQIDPDRLRGDIERGLRDLPRRFEYSVPDMVVPYLGSRARLGVTVQSMTRDLQEYFGATNGGVLVSSVTRESAAEKAGLKAGDVITAINGRSVSDQSDLMRELRDADGELTLSILRDKKEMTLKANVGAAKEVVASS
jgi:serine protease Do